MLQFMDQIHVFLDPNSLFLSVHIYGIYICVCVFLCLVWTKIVWYKFLCKVCTSTQYSVYFQYLWVLGIFLVKWYSDVVLAIYQWHGVKSYYFSPPQSFLLHCRFFYSWSTIAPFLSLLQWFLLIDAWLFTHFLYTPEFTHFTWTV